MIKNNKGFTLIELLVVVAIIGILSSVVLASLNNARTKGADAAIKSNLANIRAQAEMLYDTNSPNSYSGLCTDATVAAMINSAKSSAGISAATVTDIATAGTSTTAVCHVASGNGSWAIDVPLKSSSANSWCVDSTGASIQITAGYLTASDVTC